MKIKYMLLALIPLCMASCSEEETFVSANNQEVRITAGVGTPSRMVLKDQNTYTQSRWQDGDAISLFTSTQSNLVYGTTLNADSTSASFTPSIMAGQAEKLQCIEGNTVYACYPTTTATNENNLIVNIPPTDNIDYKNGKLSSFCYAVNQITNGHLNFNFKHLFAFLCVTVTPDIVPIGNSVNVTVSTSSDAPLSVGEGDTFDFSTLTANTTKGTNTVRMNLASSNDSIWSIYIPILPQPGNADITITLTNAHEENLYTLTKQTPANGFQASNVYKLDTSASFDVAYLVDGPTFNASIKQLADGSGSIFHNNYSIAKVEFLTEVETLPEQYITVSANNSPVPIYASFNPTDSLLTVFTPTKEIEIVNAESMFRCFESLHTIDFGNFNVNETTKNMSQMFNFCSALTSLDVSNWNTENITDMSYMFHDCNDLTSLDVSNWNTGNVTDIEYMFYYCPLTSLNVSNWDTSKVTNMGGVFYGCSALTSLDVSNWNTEKVINMEYIFTNCKSLTSLEVSNWNTKNVQDMSSMFSQCSALTSLDVSNWNTANVTDMGGIFSGCSALTSLNVSKWNTEKVTSMYSVFNYCSALTSLDVSNWKTDNVQSMGSMFYGCSALTSLDVSNWDTKNVTEMQDMFQDCSALTSLDVSNWNTEKVQYMRRVFYACSALTSLDVSNWNLSNVYSINSMFAGCSALTSLDVSNWDTTNMNYIGGIFSGCSALTSLDLSNWNTAKVTEMYNMFENCSALTSLDLSNWDTAKVTEMYSMFAGCSALTSLNLSNWNTAKVFRMSGMFSGCSALTSLNLSNWKFYGNNNANIEIYIGGMFSNCASTSKACKITTTQEAKDFLLTTSCIDMTPEWFIWGDTSNDGSGFEEMPKEEW